MDACEFLFLGHPVDMPKHIVVLAGLLAPFLIGQARTATIALDSPDMDKPGELLITMPTALGIESECDPAIVAHVPIEFSFLPLPEQHNSRTAILRPRGRVIEVERDGIVRFVGNQFEIDGFLFSIDTFASHTDRDMARGLCEEYPIEKKTSNGNGRGDERFSAESAFEAVGSCFDMIAGSRRTSCSAESRQGQSLHVHGSTEGSPAIALSGFLPIDDRLNSTSLDVVASSNFMFAFRDPSISAIVTGVVAFVLVFRLRRRPA